MSDCDYMRSVRPMVAKLAAEASEQLDSTPEGVSFTADVLEDAELIFRTAIGSHGVGLSGAEKRVVAGLQRRIDVVTEPISPRDVFWEDESLASDPRWSTIRHAARAALSELDRSRGRY